MPKWCNETKEAVKDIFENIKLLFTTYILLSLLCDIYIFLGYSVVVILLSKDLWCQIREHRRKDPCKKLYNVFHSAFREVLCRKPKNERELCSILHQIDLEIHDDLTIERANKYIRTCECILESLEEI